MDAPDDVVVISDADTFPEPGPLRAAVAAAAQSGRVHLPYTAYRWLGPQGSAQFAEGAPGRLRLRVGAQRMLRRVRHDPTQLGTSGGQDERFRGWGFEDTAWYAAHETLIGAPPQRHEGRVYALHHAVEARTGLDYDRNAKLMERYLIAAGESGGDERLVAEGQAAELPSSERALRPRLCRLTGRDGVQARPGLVARAPWRQ